MHYLIFFAILFYSITTLEGRSFVYNFKLIEPYEASCEFKVNRIDGKGTYSADIGKPLITLENYTFIYSTFASSEYIKESLCSILEKQKYPWSYSPYVGVLLTMMNLHDQSCPLQNNITIALGGTLKFEANQNYLEQFANGVIDVGFELTTSTVPFLTHYIFKLA